MARRGSSKKSGKSSGSGFISQAAGALGKLGGGSKSRGGGSRRKHGPNYWANKVLVEKLKRKYYKLHYSGMR